MLVFTRRANETIVIDHRIVVTIVSTSGGNVKIGVEAPPEITVNRGEIQVKLDASQRITPEP